MFKFWKTKKALKKLKKIEPERSWLESRRFYFKNLVGAKRRLWLKPAFFKTRLATVTVLAALLLLSGGGFVINSAEAALPDSALYPIKLLSEQFREFFVFGTANKVDFALKLAERRLEEAEAIETDDEEVIIGTIVRAENNLAETQEILSHSKSFKNIEKAFEKLDKLANHRAKLVEKFQDKLPRAIAALEGFGLTSVDIEEEANRIIITITADTATSSTSTSLGTVTVSDAALQLLEDRASASIQRAVHKLEGVEDKITAAAGETALEAEEKLNDAEEKLAEANEEFAEGDYRHAIQKANAAYKKAVDAEIKLLKYRIHGDLEINNDNHGTSQIIKLLIEGAGKSGKIPPGLLKAPGIKKKLEGRNDDEDDDGNEEEDDSDEPEIFSVSVSAVASSSASISWTTDELSTGTVYYSLVSPVDKNASGTESQTDDSLVLDHNLTLSNLNATTTYFFFVEAEDEAENTASSSELSFTTGE